MEDNNNKLINFISYSGSMTAKLKQLHPKVHIDNYLNEIFANKYYKRQVKIYLDNKLVILADSFTKLSNDKFMYILTNSLNQPIGNKLFDENSEIHRTTMRIKQLNMQIIKRQSIFKYHTQYLLLIEYFQPILKNFL